MPHIESAELAKHFTFIDNMIRLAAKGDDGIQGGGLSGQLKAIRAHCLEALDDWNSPDQPAQNMIDSLTLAQLKAYLALHMPVLETTKASPAPAKRAARPARSSTVVEGSRFSALIGNNFYQLLQNRTMVTNRKNGRKTFIRDIVLEFAPDECCKINERAKSLKLDLLQLLTRFHKEKQFQYDHLAEMGLDQDHFKRF